MEKKEQKQKKYCGIRKMKGKEVVEMGIFKDSQGILIANQCDYEVNILKRPWTVTRILSL